MACVMLWLVFVVAAALGLRPQVSESRTIQLLDGIWNFKHCQKGSPELGYTEKWFLQSLQEINGSITMPVPASFNDITQDKAIRDHVGWVWYDREFYVSSQWADERVVLRFDSVHYFARVWINGIEIMEHVGGHLPFEHEVNNVLKFKAKNRVTVAVNNTLTPLTLPCGHIVYPDDINNYPAGYFRQELIFDFFNYAGIHRSVSLYTTPKVYISDVMIVTNIQGNVGIVTYNVSVQGTDHNFPNSNQNCTVEIFEKDVLVGASSCYSQLVIIDKAKLWWPFTMDPVAGYLYNMKITLYNENTASDIYRQAFGVREVAVKSDGLYINDKLFYFRGFGKHEDFHIHGRGFNLPLMIKDFNLLKWTTGNSFRTSHYPYSEDFMDYADAQGIVIIDESPAVGLHEFPNETLQHHLKVMEELVNRDRNHPSVVMWSVANEPKSYAAEAEPYFRTVIEYTKKLDPTRPVTFVIGGSNASLDKAAQFLDILCVNHYFAWYSDPGHTELVRKQLKYDTRQWAKKFQRPVIVTEYGADTLAGLHTSPSFIFSEEYQTEFMAEYHSAFDDLRNEGILAGEMVWNFADFMTDQQITRVWGNRKGVFTRERQPKAAAHFIRQRYRTLTDDQRNNTIAFYEERDLKSESFFAEVLQI